MIMSFTYHKQKELKTRFFERVLRWEWFYNTKRFHSTIGMTPYEKLCCYVKLPKNVSLFPVMNLDEMSDFIKLYFKSFPFTQLDTIS